MSNTGKMFDTALLAEIREKFYFVDTDPARNDAPRMFFDNAGGSFRLKQALDEFYKYDRLPDCPERIHETAKILQKIENRALEDVKMMFNVTEGSVLTFLTASMAIFEMTRVIAENVPGSNIVTTLLEHPSAYDSAKLYADKLGKELRSAKTNRITGGVDVEAITSLIDKNTSFLSVIYASNISGAILDLEAICREARKIKPDLFIICDAVQPCRTAQLICKKAR